jgi:hypothetical protein
MHYLLMYMLYTPHSTIVHSFYAIIFNVHFMDFSYGHKKTKQKNLFIDTIYELVM